MKLKNLYVAFLFISVIGFLSSCSDDKDAPIRLKYHAGSPEAGDYIDHGLRLFILSGERLIDIHGGDGSFTIENRNENVVKTILDKRTITFIPQSEGNAQVVIKDNSGKTYPLSVWVGYHSVTFSVAQLDIHIKGYLLTVGDKNKLEEEIRAYIPAEEKDQYVFTFTDQGNTEGRVEFCTSAPEYVKGTFRFDMKMGHNPGYHYVRTIMMKIGEKEYVYDFGVYSNTLGTRMDYTPPYMFVDDVTEKFKEKYPALEKAWVVQKLRML